MYSFYQILGFVLEFGDFNHTHIKGITEHIEKRIGWVTETVYPDLPFYDKPTASSKIALLNMALNDQKKNTSVWQKLLKRLGGKKI